MKWKKLRPLLALPMAALLLFATACQEQTPSDANSGNGGVLVSQEESGTSENASESDFGSTDSTLSPKTLCA